ncbi:hypothetical protein C2I33_13230 [Ralstonia solanacearum]|nr:hypothetical protein C2I33_13230 [Ralstonia solanacearum]
MLAQVAPQRKGFGLVDPVPAEPGAGRPHRRLGAAQADPQRVADPRGGGNRQRLATPAVERVDGLGLRHGKAQRGIAERHRQDFQRDLHHQPQGAQRARHQA